MFLIAQSTEFRLYFILGYSKRGSRYELGGWIGRDVMDNGSIFINQEEVKENRDILKSTFRTVLCIQYLEYRVGKGSHRRAAQAKRNLILQTSTKAFQQLDKEEMRFFVTNYARRKGICVYLHLDHCKKIALIKEAVDYGWDSVMVDASEQLLLENIKWTNQVCGIAKEHGVLVEAEVGQIAGVEEEIKVQEAGIACIEDVKQFLEGTEVDMLAVAIGTAHGLYKGTPSLHYDLLSQVAELADIPLVIHGGTGLEEGELRRLLSYKNVKKINISTDVKLAYRQGICKSLKMENLRLPDSIRLR